MVHTGPIGEGLGEMDEPVKVTTRRCEEQFGFHLVTDGGEQVGTLRIDDHEEGGRSFVLDVQGIESFVETAGEVQEQLAARGFQLDDLADANEVARHAKRYGVRVSRNPDESTVFRMEFMSGERIGEVVEVDVRADGHKVDNVPDDWRHMSAVVPQDYDDTPGDVTMPIELLMDMLRNARQAGRHNPARKPDASTEVVHRDLVDNMLTALGISWYGIEED